MFSPGKKQINIDMCLLTYYDMSIIKRLDEVLINQIAAGEVIESPFAVIKELIENAIDADATSIDVIIRNGGKSYIQIKDNGSGMSFEDMALSLERHATSKLTDLFQITTFGFRGEALPSIASISRFAMISKTKSSPSSKIELEGGVLIHHSPYPTSFLKEQGTDIIVKDLFFATPARLKFLKNDAAEQLKCINTVKKLALSHFNVGFKLHCDDKLKLQFHPQTSLEARVMEVFDDNFKNNATSIFYERDHIQIKGMISPPTLNQTQSYDQHVFINQRPVKDKLLSMSIKLAYGDTVPHNRYPSVCLYVKVPPEDVDVNVHPSKTEVRFHDAPYIKDHMIRAIREFLPKNVSSHVMNLAHYQSQTTSTSKHVYEEKKQSLLQEPLRHHEQTSLHQPQSSYGLHNEARNDKHEEPKIIQFPIVENTPLSEPCLFGEPKLQIFDMFILAQRDNELLLIDQHAAHERVLYERYKKTFIIKEKMQLLIPEVIQVSPEIFDFIKTNESALKQTFIDCSVFGQNEIIIHAVPSLFKDKDIKKIILDFIHNVIEYENDHSVNNFINSILATLACHNAIKAGQSLNIFEMRHLLQEMSVTPHIAQCNHGRPTHVVLEKKALEKIFLRI